MPKTLISKELLERNQIPIYAAALILGGIIELSSLAVGSALEVAIYPVLGVLLYATFLQVLSRSCAALSPVDAFCWQRSR